MVKASIFLFLATGDARVKIVRMEIEWKMSQNCERRRQGRTDEPQRRSVGQRVVGRIAFSLMTDIGSHLN